jgi:hypothetical protein
VLTFGGRSPNISSVANDTFAWNGTAWAALPTPNAPPARYLHGMSYDSAANRVVVFGGRTATTTIGDTWTFDGVAWTQVQSPTAPAPRESMAMAYDVSRNRTVLFGGYDRDTDTIHGDTWEFDGSTWRQRAPAVSPTARYTAAFVYDRLRVRTVLYGGFDGASLLRETYEYAGGDWLQMTIPGTNIGTPFASEMYSGFDPGRNRFVTFGGVGTQFSNETWEYTGVNTAMFIVFGSACSHLGSGSSLSAVTRPILGTNFQVVATDTPATSTFGLMAAGFSDTTWNGAALPFDLSIVGLTGCNLLVAADVLAFMPLVAGELQFALALPNNTGLLGQSMFLQAFVEDASAPNGLGGISRAGRAVFGSS